MYIPGAVRRQLKAFRMKCQRRILESVSPNIISNGILLSCTGLTHLSDILSQPRYVVSGHVFHLGDGVAANMIVTVKLICCWFVFPVLRRRTCQPCNRWLDQVRLIKFLTAERIL